MLLRCSRACHPLFSSQISLTFSPPKHSNLNSFLSFKPHSRSSTITMSATPSQTIEHVVLFKVKPETEPSKVNGMLSGLNGLISLDQVVHVTAGPVHRSRSSLSNFTHMLHSRYSSKENLSEYASHPSHVSVVKESVLPICEEIMAVDWVSDQAPKEVSPGSAVRVTLLKLKENLGVEAKNEVVAAIKGIKESFGGKISEISLGENFSPARAKGFSIASLAVFPGLSEIEAVDAEEELANLHKEKAREYLEGVIVIDYVVPAAQSANL